MLNYFVFLVACHRAV